MDYEIVIGLEIHLQLKTKSKMFCSCPIVETNELPNSAVCPICMGHPGTLPVINLDAVRQAVKLGLAVQCDVADITQFERKNYFYPDLPKGYQISQFSKPLATGGYVFLLQDGNKRRVRLERLHLEEDAGKNFHIAGKTLVDFNRVGIPLAEIVTEADIRSPAEAKQFLQELRLIARYCGVSDADMEKGQMRCDANISLRPIGDTKLYPKTEVKNMNSFKAVERALTWEAKRQAALWQEGIPPQGGETRGWDEEKGETIEQRTKEESQDYRYFPEPDLKPLAISSTFIERMRETVPELPYDKRTRFMEQFGLSYDEAAVLVARKDVADFFEAVVSELKRWFEDIHSKREEDWNRESKKLTKYTHAWMTSELLRHLNADGKIIAEMAMTAENMAELITMISEGQVTSNAAQIILERMYHKGGDPSHIAEEENLYQTSDVSEIQKFVQDVIRTHPKQVSDYKAGKQAVLKFLIGKVMQASGGKANPQVAEELLKDVLKE